MSAAPGIAVDARRPAAWRHGLRWLLLAIEVAAAALLAADLLVVVASVLGRFFFDAPMTWSDDVARMLLLAVTFFGAAAALAHGDNAGVTFFVDRLPPRWRGRVDALVGLLVAIAAAALCWTAFCSCRTPPGRRSAPGVPQELFFAPLVHCRGGDDAVRARRACSRSASATSGLPWSRSRSWPRPGSPGRPGRPTACPRCRW